jgi:glycosyltransferase involved in cell wall biosynthesis
MIIGIDVRGAGEHRAGIGTNFYELAHTMGEIDHSNSIFLYSRGNFQPAHPLPKNVRVISFNVPLCIWHPLVGLHARLNHVASFLTPSNITALFLKSNQLILYIPDMSGIVLAKYHTFKVLALSKLYHVAARKARAILTISEFSKKEIVTHLNVNKSKVFATLLAPPPGFRKINDERELARCKQELGLPKRFILFVGSLEPRKNILGLLKALLIIDPEERPALVVAGGQGWKNSDIYKFIEEYNLKNTVSILGYQSKESLVALYNLAKVFVFPSFYEGFGLPVLEAFSCGTPVIASNTSSIPEVAGSAALLINPDNSEEIAEVIKNIFKDSELQKRCVEKGFEQIKKFSWKKNAEETLKAFYTGIIAQNN